MNVVNKIPSFIHSNVINATVDGNEMILKRNLCNELITFGFLLFFVFPFVRIVYGFIAHIDVKSMSNVRIVK